MAPTSPTKDTYSNPWSLQLVNELLRDKGDIWLKMFEIYWKISLDCLGGLTCNHKGPDKMEVRTVKGGMKQYKEGDRESSDVAKAQRQSPVSRRSKN